MPPHPEEISGFVFTQEEPCVGGMLPPLGHVGCKAPSCRILHDKGKVLLCQDGLLGVHNADVTLPQLRLDLHDISDL